MRWRPCVLCSSFLGVSIAYPVRDRAGRRQHTVKQVVYFGSRKLSRYAGICSAAQIHTFHRMFLTYSRLSSSQRQISTLQQCIPAPPCGTVNSPWPNKQSCKGVFPMDQKDRYAVMKHGDNRKHVVIGTCAILTKIPVHRLLSCTYSLTTSAREGGLPTLPPLPVPPTLYIKKTSRDHRPPRHPRGFTLAMGNLGSRLPARQEFPLRKGFRTVRTLPRLRGYWTLGTAGRCAAWGIIDRLTGTYPGFRRQRRWRSGKRGLLLSATSLSS